MTVPFFGLLALLLLGAVFYGLRRSIAASAWASAVLLAAVSYLVLRSPGGRSSEAIILLAGLGLTALGLLIVRVMLVRSVSLRLLAAYAADGPPEGMQELIGHRLGDLSRHRLARVTAGTYRLTAFGRVVAAVVGISYALTRVRS
jgi:hypothetical protein